MSEITLSQRIDRAVGAVECERLQGLHVYLHAAGIHREEYQRYWSRREDITWAHGFGQNGNRWTYWQNYVLCQEFTTFTRYKDVMAAYPQVRELEDYRPVAEYSNHFLTSPVIEVAEDGLSAKGLFYTPGFIASFCTSDGKCRGTYLFERYGADFVYEDGRWVYLNLRVCPDIGGEMSGGGYAEPRQMPPRPPQPEGKKGEAPPMNPQQVLNAPYEIPGPLYNNWSPTQTVQKMPPLPEPYRTLDETFLYSEVETLGT